MYTVYSMYVLYIPIYCFYMYGLWQMDMVSILGFLIMIMILDLYYRMKLCPCSALVKQRYSQHYAE